MPQPHKLHNWSDYNRSLKQRGDIFFFFDKKISEYQRRGNQKYSDETIIICNQVKYLLKLAFRQTQGFLESLAKRKLEILSDIPDYTTMCKRMKSLNLAVKDFRKNKSESVAVAIDSTGISIYDMNDWHRKMSMKHRKNTGLKRYKKMHVMMDLESRQILDVKLTQSSGPGTGDYSVGKEFINNSKNNIRSVVADGAYNGIGMYVLCYKKNIHKVLIPPSRNHNLQKLFLPLYKLKNDAISYIRAYKDWDVGLKHWKEEKGYHIRSRIESYMAAFKRTFGRALKSKCDTRRKNEILLKINILNKVRTLTIPISTKV